MSYEWQFSRYANRAKMNKQGGQTERMMSISARRIGQENGRLGRRNGTIEVCGGRREDRRAYQ